MGVGDVLMSMGEARKAHKSNGLPVLIVDTGGRPVKSDLFNGVRYISSTGRFGGKPFTRITNGPGQRPYIKTKTAAKWTWRPYKPIPAELVFSAEEKAFAEPFRGMVMIEPNVKANGHDNKAWLPMRWAELTKALDHLPLVQCVPTPTTPHPSVDVLKVLTPNFRLAVAVLSVAKAFIGTEGGLHHAAAAVGTPAVILWSEFISPSITGYSTMVNLRHAGKPCGNRIACAGCRRSMEAISVNEVTTALKEILK